MKEIIAESIALAEKLRGDLEKTRKALEDHQEEFKQLDPKNPNYEKKSSEWVKKWHELTQIKNSTFSTLMTFSDIWSILKSG
jgi:predicted nuclease with TOPRIM domain